MLKNLLSNACKFTEQGECLAAHRARADRRRASRAERCATAETVVAFAVTDTGIGIAEDKLKLIFEAFQQADGTTSRRYGGTGLGLSISREIARLLGGEIQVESAAGKGTTFTLYLPVSHRPAARVEASDDAARTRAARAIAHRGASDDRARSALRSLPSDVDDDRDAIDDDDRVVLDRRGRPRLRARVLEVARGRGFKGIVALRGDAGLALAHEYKPDAIGSTCSCRDDGWAVLDRLKRDPDTRHIPVHVVSGAERTPRARSSAGAVAFLEKPVEQGGARRAFAHIASFLEPRRQEPARRRGRRAQREAIVELHRRRRRRRDDGGRRRARRRSRRSSSDAFDCMVLDLSCPTCSGFELLEQVEDRRRASRRCR